MNILKTLRIIAPQVLRSCPLTKSSTTSLLSSPRQLNPFLPVSRLLSGFYNNGNTAPSPILQNAAALRLTPLSPLSLVPLSVNTNQVRTLTKFSLRKGKRKAVKPVIKRFLRLDWGIWIHTKTGRHKKMWRKSSSQKRRLRQHVFCNATQSHLLDKMVTKFWRKRRYYVDDPYEPYHSREEFPHTRKKPVSL